MSRPRKIFVEKFVFAIFLSILDMATVTPALAVIAKQYHLSLEWSVWTLSLHLAFFSFSLPILESWSTQVGRQTALYTSLLIFALGSLIVAISDEWVWFMWGRVIQAIGTGGIVPYVAFQIRKIMNRGKRQEQCLVYVLLGTLMILTPILSAIIVQFINWKALFLMNLPLSFFIYLFAKRSQIEERSVHQKYFLGSGLFFFGILLLFFMLAITFTDLTHGWRSFTLERVIPLWIMAIGMIVPLLMVERQSKHPFFEPHLFAHWRLWLLYIQVALSGFCWMALVLVPIWIIHLFRLDTLWYGYILSLILFWSVFAWPVIRFISNRWNVKITSMLGFLCAVSAYTFLTWFRDEWSLLITISLLGVGLSLTIATPFHQLLFRWVPARRIRNGLMAIGMFRAAGGALGLVTMARLFSSYDPMVAGWFIIGGPAEETIWLAIQDVMQFAAFTSCLGFILSLVMPTSKKRLSTSVPR